MFGFIGDITESVVDTVEDFVDDPIATTVYIVTQPLRDSLDVLEGLSEGELRTRAALRLGSDVVAGMATSKLIEVLLEE